MRVLATVVIAVVVAGCASPRSEGAAKTPSSPASADMAPPASTSAAPPGKPADPPHAPPDVPAPSEVACELVGKGLRHVRLHAPGDDAPWGTAFTRPRFVIPPDGSGRPVATGETAAARLRSETTLAAVEPRLAKPAVIAGVLVPDGRVALTLARAAKSGLTVVAKARGVTPRSPLEIVVPCGDLTLDDAPASPRALAPDTAKSERRVLPEGKSVPLAATEVGEPIAMLEGTGERGTKVEVVGTRKDLAHVVVDLPEGVLFGFVPSSALVAPVPRKWSGPTGATFGIPSAPKEPGGAPVRCASEVPLLVQVGDVRHAVGVVLAGRTLFVLAARERYAEVALGRDLEVDARAKLLVPATALEGCTKGGP